MLLTRAPLYSPGLLPDFPFDLHVLGTPPAFILSQDQTLRLNFELTKNRSDLTVWFSKIRITTHSLYRSDISENRKAIILLHHPLFPVNNFFNFFSHTMLFSHSPNSENTFSQPCGNYSFPKANPANISRPDHSVKKNFPPPGFFFGIPFPETSSPTENPAFLYPASLFVKKKNEKSKYLQKNNISV